MKILAIDYGRKKIGIAFSETNIAQPLKVIKIKNLEDALKKVLGIKKQLLIDKMIVGVSEGQMAQESKMFADKIGAEIYDETLSTQTAQRLSLEGNISRKKRKKLEDAYAAAVMLQLYLENYV